MTNKKIFRFWLMMFVGFFALFVLLQVPATWLLGKFYPNMRYIHNVSGNIWQGEADWAYQDLQGTMTWSTRPWEILRLRASSNITLHSGQTEIHAIVAYGLGKNIYLSDVNGEISSDTLANLVDWQWPSSNIKLKNVSVKYKKQQGYQDAEGQLTWAGGLLNYPIAQRLERIDIPPLVGQLSAENDQLKLAVRDSQQQRMADLSLDKDSMLDVQVTQRLLINAPSYQGQAGMDTAVVSTRQPLGSL